ncbi:MAG: MBL fold metallo-hydrolase [Coriobacteriales bacterium]|jgi:beta-lactamase superfamily II metal-dependent hydrolase|nr:MBL fold metallo-hydrolase [Coriobacteriales bacterium]
MVIQGKNRRIVTFASSILLAFLLVSAPFLQSCSLPEQGPASNPPANQQSNAASEQPSASNPLASPQSSAVSIHVFDVGEGLAVLIDDGEYEVIIDGGEKRFGAAFSAYLASYVDGSIEYVIATHSHADHVGGLTQIYADYQVDHTIYGDTGTSRQYEDFENAAKAEPGSDFKNDETETITLSEGVTLSILDVVDDDKNTNNNSVISVLDAGGIKTLITGDAEERTEKLLASSIGEVTLFIVGHHGSETSSSQVFLDEIRPEFGIISSQGPIKGSYYNPDIEVLRRLAALGTELYATYRSGTIVATIDGGSIHLSPPASERITPENYQNAA